MFSLFGTNIESLEKLICYYNVKLNYCHTEWHNSYINLISPKLEMSCTQKLETETEYQKKLTKVQTQ
jgi:hypothetical protein